MTKVIRLPWPKSQRAAIRVPLYGGAFYFVDNVAEYNQMIDYLSGVPNSADGFIDLCNGCVSNFENEQGGALYLIGVFDGSYGTLAHEVGHLTTFILERAGVPIDVHTTEAFCYLQGHLFEEVQERLDASNVARAEAELEEAKAAGEPTDQKTTALINVLKPSQGSYKSAKHKGARRGRS